MPCVSEDKSSGNGPEEKPRPLDEKALQQALRRGKERARVSSLFFREPVDATRLQKQRLGDLFAQTLPCNRLFNAPLIIEPLMLDRAHLKEMSADVWSALTEPLTELQAALTWADESKGPAV